MVCLGNSVGRAPAHKAGDPGLNPGLGENVPLKINNTGPARGLF